MIINKSNGQPRWFRCKDGTAVMVVDYGNGFRVSSVKGSHGPFFDWGVNIDYITSYIGPVEWPAKEEPPLDLSGWEVGVEHLVKCRDGKRRMACRGNTRKDSKYPIIVFPRNGESWNYESTDLHGSVKGGDRNDECDIVHDFGPLDSLELGEVSR